MKKYDLMGGLAWFIVGLLFCIGSMSLGLGSFGEPGPGFFPFLMSVFLMFFSLVYILFFVRKSGSAGGVGFWPQIDGIKRIGNTIISMFMYTIAMNYIGFTITSFLFMIFLLRFIEPQKWITVFLTSVFTTALSYAMFQLWLKANLPTGPWGF